MIYDIVIIGGGPSGMTSALYALRNSKKVLIIEKEAFGGQIATSPRVENYPSYKEISGLEFSDALFDQISSLGVDFELEDVESVKKEGDLFKIKTNYNEYQSKVVIIANGVVHRKMNLNNEDRLLGHGVSYCAICDGAFYKGQEAYVIGDANSALQYALLLCNYCPKVHLVALFDHLFADDLLIKRVLDNPKIDIKYNMSLKEFIGDNELEGLLFENTKTKEEIRFDTTNVFIAIGQIPQNEMFKDLLKLDNGYILTDENMETTIPALFAVGDTRKKDVRQLITACNDGAIAAMKALKYLD